LLDGELGQSLLAPLLLLPLERRVELALFLLELLDAEPGRGLHRSDVAGKVGVTCWSCGTAPAASAATGGNVRVGSECAAALLLRQADTCCRGCRLLGF